MGKRHVMLASLGAVAALFSGCLVLAFVMVSHTNINSTTFGGICALFVAGCLLGVASWVLGLINVARIGRWDWFIVVLLLGPLGVLLYGFAGPEQHTGDTFADRAIPIPYS